MYEFVRGPLLWVALVVFGIGFAWQMIRSYRLAARPESGRRPSLPPKHREAVTRPLKERILLRWALFKTSPWAAHPLLSVVSLLFHALLLTTPWLILAHNILIEESWGVQFYSLPESTADALTVVVLLCCTFFLGRRLLDRHARAISSWSDYALLLLTAAPFATGFLAYHQWFDYHTMLIAHILLAEILIALIPYTKLMHMIFFVSNRLLAVGEYSYSKNGRD